MFGYFSPNERLPIYEYPTSPRMSLSHFHSEQEENPFDVLTILDPLLRSQLMRYQQKRDMILQRENRDILREQVKKGLADYYRMQRHVLYQNMKKAMQMSEASCVNIHTTWPHVRRLLDYLILLVESSQDSREKFDSILQHTLRQVLTLYDHVVPSIDHCRAQSARELFDE
jgi:hypothetical protein